MTVDETAGDVLYRVEQMHAYVEATAKALQALNLRLLGFGVETFDGNAVRLGGGRYASFADCRGIVDVIVATRLGGGQKAKRHLEIVGTPCAETRQVSVAEGELAFQDLELAESNGSWNGGD